MGVVLFALLGLKVSSRLGYFALAALVAVESAGVPVPGETALITSGVLARDGQLKLGLVIAVAAGAAIVGDNIGYAIGRTGGRRLLERPGLLQHRRRQILDQGGPFFERHGPKAVFLGRWVAGLRIAAAWLAGINRMHWKVFVFWNALGGVAWAASVGLLAYLLGPAAERAMKVAGSAGVVAAILAIGGFMLWRRRRARSAADVGRRSG